LLFLSRTKRTNVSLSRLNQGLRQRRWRRQMITGRLKTLASSAQIPNVRHTLPPSWSAVSVVMVVARGSVCGRMMILCLALMMCSRSGSTVSGGWRPILTIRAGNRPENIIVPLMLAISNGKNECLRYSE
ncbi:MAG: hypothetical protein KAU52_10575, partial [Methanosarcinales archaeon]|nr:hypothetical protein [Methanosarcinales archaeon]